MASDIYRACDTHEIGLYPVAPVKTHTFRLIVGSGLEYLEYYSASYPIAAFRLQLFAKSAYN